MFLAFILMVSLMVFVLQTRSGLIALIVASTFFTSADFFLSPRRVFFRLSVGAGVLFLVCALVLYLFPILLYLIQHPEIQYSEEWRQLPVLQQVVFRADAHRFELWGNFLKDWYTCGLWTGCGPAFETQRPLLDGFIPYAHNIYLAFGLHNGLPAIFLFLALCIFSLRTAWRKRDPWGAYLLVSLSGLFFEGNQIINSPNECWLLVLLPMALIAHPGFPGVRTRHFVDSKSENSNFQA
jgi:O-antigen ligase